MLTSDILLVSPDYVKSTAEINYNSDDSVVGGAIRSAHRFLRDIIGTALLERLQELVKAKIEGSAGTTIDSEEAAAYKALLNEYVQPYLAEKTAMILCSRQSYKLRNFGLTKNASMNINPADLSEILWVKEEKDVLANDAANRMMEFICANKDAYPEADAKCGCGKSPRYAATNLWLG